MVCNVILFATFQNDVNVFIFMFYGTCRNQYTFHQRVCYSFLKINKFVDKVNIKDI